MIKLLMVVPAIYHNPLVSFKFVFVRSSLVVPNICDPPPLSPLKRGLLLGLHNRVGASSVYLVGKI